MATELEENFVKEHIKGNDVFEFGCSPGKFTEEIAKDYDVTAIDLYDAKLTKGYKFIKGDLLETSIKNKFDSVICLSSLEHCGIESLNYTLGNKEDLTTLQPIADKLATLIKVGGRLLITAPFGDTNIYYVDKDGNNGTRTEIDKPKWGFRTFKISDIATLFKELHLDTYYVYENTKGDYFKEDSWIRASYKNYNLYNNKKRGLLCCVLEKRA